MSDYVPIEYPKWLHSDVQPDALVQDAAEEKRVLASWRKAVPVPPPVVVPDVPEAEAPKPEQPVI